MKKNKAITLVSLVITVVLLIILASVVLILGLGNNGILNKAKEGKEETNKQTATEKINLKITAAQMDSYAQKQEMPTLKELSLVLEEDKEIEYVTEISQIANIKYGVGEAPTTIFTKLKDYKYEFEINSSLQLASINEIKIGTNVNQSNMQVLWENPSKTEDFNGQIIDWGEKNASQGTKEGASQYEYNYLIIEHSSGNISYSEMASKGENMKLTRTNEDSTGRSYYIMERWVEYISSTSLKFGDVQIFQMLKSGGFNKFLNWNDHCKPIKIIGIK